MLASESGIKVKEEASLFMRSCAACEQHFMTRKAWQEHLNSPKHAVKTAETDSKTSSSSDESSLSNPPSLNTHGEHQPADQGEDFSPSQCLFCTVESASLESNLTHMAYAHSFFLPHADYLIDTTSFFRYLFALVSIFHECLFCGRSKTTKVGVQDHMRRKGHCKVGSVKDDERDLGQFYDFSVDADGDDEGDGPEAKVPLVSVIEDEFRLPSGKILGHRSRARFFRQHHSDNPLSSSSASSARQKLSTESERVPTKSTDRRLAIRAGSSTSLIGVPELQFRALIAVDNKMRMMETREKSEYRHVLEKGGNKQKRFKVASMGKKQGGLEKRLG